MCARFLFTHGGDQVIEVIAETVFRQQLGYDKASVKSRRDCNKLELYFKDMQSRPTSSGAVRHFMFSHGIGKKRSPLEPLDYRTIYGMVSERVNEKWDDWNRGIIKY